MRAENVIRRKSTWIQGVNAVGVYAVYLMTIFGQAQDSAVAEIAYQRPLLTAIGVAIVVSIVARIVVAIASPKEADKKDERDTTSIGMANTSDITSSSSVHWQHSAWRWQSSSTSGSPMRSS